MFIAGLNQLFIKYEAIIITILTLLQLGVLIIMLCATFSTRKLRNRYNALIKDSDNKNLEEVMLSLGERILAIEDSQDKNKKSLTEHRVLSEFHIQRWSLLRYKAFSNTGGDQSFSMALLDGRGNGVIISSIYGRDESRVYAKSVTEGHSTYALSSEEEAALKQALNNERNNE